MNWSAISAIVSVLTLVGVVGVGGVLWGRMTERLKSVVADVENLKDGFNLQKETSHKQDGRLIRLEEWRRGYECGRRGDVEGALDPQ